MRSDPRGLTLEVLLVGAGLWAGVSALGLLAALASTPCAGARTGDVLCSLLVIAGCAVLGRRRLGGRSPGERRAASSIALGPLGAWLVAMLAGVDLGPDTLAPSVSAASLAAAGISVLWARTASPRSPAWVSVVGVCIAAALAGGGLSGCSVSAAVLAGTLGAGLGGVWAWAWWWQATHAPGSESTEGELVSPLVYVVFNPTKHADVVAAEALLRGALTEAGVPEVRWVETSAEDGGYSQALAAREAGATLVIACGGDGTVRACVQALAGSDVALGIVPAGTGNLLAANLGIPTDLDRAAVCAVSGARRRIDVGVSGEERFAVMAGMGFDARMVGEAPEEVKARLGWGAYVLSAVRNLGGRSPRFEIWIDDDEVRTTRARAVLVANVGRLTGGIELLPDARADDGRLDVAILDPRGLWGWTELAAHVLTRQGERSRGLEVHRCERVRIRCERLEPVEFDGDAQPPRRELEAHVLSGGLVVCVPHAALGARAADAEEPPTQEERGAQTRPTREDETAGRDAHEADPPRVGEASR